MFIKRFTIKLHDKLLTTTNGKIYNGFLRWKLLPEPKDRLPLAVNDLERKLTNLAKNALKATFDPLKDELFEGENKQKRAAKDLIFVTMNKEKKLFLHWVIHNANCRNIERTKTILNTFENLNQVATNNASPIFESEKDGDRKEKILKKLIQNTNNKAAEAYMKWKNYLHVLRIQNLLDKNLQEKIINKLNDFLNNNEENLKRKDS